MRNVGRAIALAALVLAASCDELGNPDVGGMRTAPTEWSAGPVRLETRTISVPPSRSNELLRAIAPARPHHLDSFAPEGGVVTLVIVAPSFALPPRARLLPLVTTFRLRDGTVVRREWSAPADAPALYAGFGLPGAPVDAVTSLAS